MANLFGASGLVGQGLRAGQKIQRLDVIGQVLVDNDEGGQDSVAEVRLANLPCIVTPFASEEKLLGGTLYASATHEIRCDYTPLIDTTVQVVVRTPVGILGRLFDVLVVTNVNERYRELQMFTVERRT